MRVVIAVVVVLSTWLHAADAPTAADPRLVEATRLVEGLGFKRARPLFAAVRAAHPAGTATWAQATFGEAVCAQHSTPLEQALIDQAIALYQELTAGDAGGALAAQACLNLGRIAELDRRDTAQARARYDEVLRRWPTSAAASEAALRLAALAVQGYCAAMADTGSGDLAAVRSALDALAAWISGHDADPLLAAHWHLLADSRLFVLKDDAGALAAYLAADARGLLTRGQEGPIWWRMAALAERQGQRDTAVRYYTRIVAEAPASGRAYDAQQALRRLGAPAPRTAIEEAFERTLRASGTAP